MSLLSLCLTYTFVCQTRLTAPDPAGISRQAQSPRTAPYLVIQSPDRDLCSPSTLICLSSVSLSVPPSQFMSFPHSPISVTFPLSPTASIRLCPHSASLKSFLLYHCHAPDCFSLPCVSFPSYLLDLFFPCACLSSFYSLLPVKYFPAWIFWELFLTSSRSLNKSIKLNNSSSPYFFLSLSLVIISFPSCFCLCASQLPVLWMNTLQIEAGSGC